MMHKRAWMMLILLVTIFHSPAYTAELETTREIRLSDARRLAMEHSYAVRTRNIDVKVAREQIKEAFRSGLPQITSDVTFANNLELPTQLIPNFFEGRPEELIEVQFGTKYSTGVNIHLDQLLFSGTYWIAVKSSKVFRQLAEENRELTELETLKLVSGTYYLALVTQENLDILRDSLENMERTLVETRARYDEGFLEETDVDQIRISVSKLENQIRSAIRQLDVTHMMLNYQMGLPLDQKLDLLTPMDAVVASVLEEPAMLTFELDSDPAVKAARTSATISELNVKNEKYQYWPKISAYVDYNLNLQEDQIAFFSDDQDWFRSVNFGIKLSFPSYTSGMQRSRIRQAEMAWEQSRIAVKEVEDGRKLAFRQAETALASARDTYKTAKANMALAARVYERTEIKYEEGMSTSMDLIQAHDQYLEQKGGYIEALSDLLDAQNDMDRIRMNFSAIDGGTAQ